MKKLLALFVFMVIFVIGLSAQKTITGLINDTEGIPLIGANVLVQGTTIGTVTDIDGSFSLSVPGDAQNLLISFTGYDTRVIDVTNTTTVDIVLENGELLDEVVIVGYGTAKRSDLVESISTVKGERIQNIPIASIDNLLQGTSTGVESTAINGKPGQNAYLRIRGLTSINGNNDPLFIVDGVPVPSSVYSSINPSDIEEFSILKDAAATSIYGARASAGVVIVTTKRGSAKNSYVEYSFTQGVNEALDDGFTLMNASQKVDYELALGVRAPMTAEERSDLLRYGTDWEDALLRKANNQQHNIAFSGGNEVGSYYVSLSRLDQQGLSLGSDFDRTSVKFNGDFKANDWITVSNSLSISRRNDTELRDRNNVQSPFVGLYTYNPYETIYNLDENGEPIINEFGEPDYNFTHTGFNIVEAINNNPESRQWSDVYGNISIAFKPITNFTFRTTAGYNFNTFKNQYFIKPNSILDFYVGDTNAPGIKRDSGNDRNRYIWNNVASYDYRLNDDHSFSVLAGTEFLKNNFESYSISGKGFPVGLSVQSVAAEITDGSTTRTEFALYSAFSSLSYTFGDNLNFKTSIRRDGSSRFGKDNRFGTFYSFAAGYDFTSLMKNVSAIDQLKLRASYGTTGNEPVNLFDAIGRLSFASYNGQTASSQGNVANPVLQWESQKAYSVGLDFGAFNNKVTGAIEYYNKKSTDLLFPNQLSRTTGFGSRPDNIGDLSNRGVEVELQVNPVRTPDLSVSFGIRYSYNKSRIDRLNTEEEIDPSNAFGSVLKAGEVSYVWKLVEFSRVDPMTGDLLYLNADGEETNAPTESDAKILSGKSAIPTFSGGFDFSVAYKGLSLNTNFSFKGGNYIYNQRRRNLLGGLDNARDNQIVEAFDYWKEPGDVTELPRPDVEVEASDSDRFLEKGDYIRLRNVQLSYAIPTSITDRVGIKQLSVFVSGTNLATFTNFIGDPEVGVFIEESASSVGGQLPGEYAGFSYPNLKSVMGGFKIRF